MNVITRPTAAALFLLLSIAFSAVAQQRRQTPAKPQPKPAATPAPTFETLVPDDSYNVYGEVRSVGQLIHSNAVNEMLEPILKLGGPPKEFKTMVKWLKAHSEDVMSSRLLIAAWPRGGKDLPETLIALEFASTAEAAKMAATLQEFLPTILPPVEEKSADTTKPAVARPSFHLQQAGSLLVFTPRPFVLNKLKLASSKSLFDDPNFRAARNRFNSEPVFAFVDVKGMQKSEEEQRKKYEDAASAEAAARARKEEDKRNAEPPAPEVEAVPQFVPEQKTTVQVVTSTDLVMGEPKIEPEPNAASMAMSGLASAFFSAVESKWPEAVGLALSMENESFDLRALFVNQTGEKSDAVPFVPLLIPGPPVVPESPNIVPADTQLFVTMSLDLSQIYTAMAKPRPNSTVYNSRGTLQTVTERVHESPFLALEKQLKISIKDDVLPLLGSEVGLSLPLTGMGLIGLPSAPVAVVVTQPDGKDNGEKNAPILLVSVKDKEGVRALMPKIIDGLGFKGVSALAQTERRDDTEVVSYAGMFSYAFIGNFLVLSSDAAAPRRVVDSYLKHETLASEIQFKGYTRWQPRPAQGQLYISSALMESYRQWAEQSNNSLMSEQTKAFLTRLSTTPQPITYSLSNEGFGPLHELHLPRNLVLMGIAGISGEANPPPALRNERMAIGALYSISHAQGQYKEGKGNGSYGTLDQLIEAKLVSKEMIENSGYRFDVTLTGENWEVSAVPSEYGKTGIKSYFMDHAFVLRGADHNGSPATSSDPPIY